MALLGHARWTLGEGMADRGDDAFGEALVAAEVARRSAGLEAQPPRLDDLQSRGQLVDGAHHRFEHAGVAIGVVVEEHRFGAALLGDPAALPDGHTDGGGG